MAKSYPTIEKTVPNTINYDQVFSLIPKYVVNPTEKRMRKIKESAYLFLSYVYPSQAYRKKHALNNNWKPILIKEFRDITRDLDKIVIDILTDETYPVLEVSKGYLVNHRPRSYRLLSEYAENCKPVKIVIQSVISENYLKKVTPKPVLQKDGSFNYLTSHYQKSIITIDPKVHQYISTLEEKLKQKLKTKNKKIQEFYNKKINAKIKKLKDHVKNIEDGKFNVVIHITNRRLYSELVYCNKELRKYILINNKKVAEVDFNASHLYTFASILNKEFFADTDNNFSLKNINKRYFEILNNGLKRSSYYPNIVLQDYAINKNIKDVSERLNVSRYDNSLLLFMLRNFDNKDIIEYRSLPFSKGMYESLDESLFHSERGREYVKKNVMFFLNMVNHRKNNPLVHTMSRCYPTVNEAIEILNGRVHDNWNLSTLLQCVESYLLLEVGITRLLEHIPDLNFVTVHDSIIVEEKYAQMVRDILVDAITAETGIPVGIGITYPTDPIDDIEKIVNKAVTQIKKSRQRSLRRDRIKLQKLSQFIRNRDHN